MYGKNQKIYLLKTENDKYTDINGQEKNHWTRGTILFGYCIGCMKEVQIGYLLYCKKYIAYCENCVVIVDRFNLSVKSALENYAKNDE